MSTWADADEWGDLHAPPARHQGLDPAAITRTIRDTAANPGQALKLGLGNVDAAAAVKAAAAKK
ncbi:hypothetical protein [Streptomyces sp. NPDC017868]|uniref:hypothetical protein n=1 Tax=unclassified Streptomyces TaxID=2593676 RepID=UPI0037BD2BFA